MRKLITVKNSLLVLALGISQAFAQTATVTLTSEKQLIRGFGGINHPEWYADLNAAERQLAYGNGANQLGFTVLRTYVSDNSANFGRGIQTAQYAYNQGAYVFASPWNPPAGQFITVNGVKRINPATYAQYADHLNSYVTFMKNNNVNLYAISVQNEPDYATDWTAWSPQEGVDFLKGYRSRINCKMITPESFAYLKNVYDPILNDAAALKNVDIFGTHLYGTQYSNFPYPLFVQKGVGKELWMTEVYTDSKYDANIWSDTYINDARHAIKVAEHIHYAMTDGNFQAYVFWPLRRLYALIHDGNSDGQGNTPAAAGTATKRGYCMAQFSKWVRPGFIRVDATKQPVTNVFVSAYKKGNDVVIVAVNKTTSAKTLTLSVPGTKVTKWERYTTSASKNIAKGTDITAGASFQVTLDAASVTTFNGIATITGLEETDSEKGMEVYPNPFQSEGVKINKPGNFTYSITDMGGIVMEQGQGQNQQTVGMKLATGVYLLSLEQNGAVTTHKIVRK
ncbi:MAG: T9SS type A sorting domain-containing protein [Opitutaceae bacterium]|nr:T9SS type A sorting domain-containing protein [Cytophagales bacterium]